MIEVYYCLPSSINPISWATGTQRFPDAESLQKWLLDKLDYGPVLITGFKQV